MTFVLCVWCALSAGCVHDNVFDFQAFNGKARLHGLKFQGVLLPNGLAVLHGPWLGPEADATMAYLSKIDDELRVLTQRLGLPGWLCVYGDSAYAESNHIVRAVPHAMASPPVRLLNDYMKRIRGAFNPACSSQLLSCVLAALCVCVRADTAIFGVQCWWRTCSVVYRSCSC